MKRTIISQLKKWKENPFRKPLILTGARQVGKTYILKEFGAQEYENVAYINCDGNSEIADIFADDYDMRRVLMVIGAISKQPIMAGKTLIILDEIQELRKGITSLKYFCENAPEYHVAVAGSLLGVAMHQGESAPVGKVDILRLFPMTFEEFLMAKGDDQLLQILRSKDWKTITMLHESLTKALREYYFVGGMPEAVKTYLTTNDANAVRTVQDNILFVYRSDMSKHVSPNEATRISMVWQSVPSQLAKENKKFIYGAVREGARAKDFEMAIQWLVDAGLVCRHASQVLRRLDGVQTVSSRCRFVGRSERDGTVADAYLKQGDDREQGGLHRKLRPVSAHEHGEHACLLFQQRRLAFGDRFPHAAPRHHNAR